MTQLQKLLVVDDDQVILVLLSDYLSSCGFSITVAESGIQCLDKLGKEKYDLLLLDFQMPVMTGLEVLRSLRSGKVHRSLPVIMLSAGSDTKSIIEAEGVQADLYLQKPLAMPTVAEAVKSLLGRKEHS
jgi:DNA-binding response OmpR family regulator